MKPVRIIPADSGIGLPIDPTSEVDLCAERRQYRCQFDWPADWNVWIRTEEGLVLFEAVCRDPSTYVRGTGTNPEAAEGNAWRQYQNIIACCGHVFEDRGYNTGVGYCVHCDMFSPNAFEPMRYPCSSCGRLTAFFRDADGGLWCMNDWQLIPPGKRSDAWTTFYNRPAVLAGYIKDYRAKFKEPTV